MVFYLLRTVGTVDSTSIVEKIKNYMSNILETKELTPKNEEIKEHLLQLSERERAVKGNKK